MWCKSMQVSTVMIELGNEIAAKKTFLKISQMVGSFLQVIC